MIKEAFPLEYFKVYRPLSEKSELVPDLVVQKIVEDVILCPRCWTPHRMKLMLSLVCECGLTLMRTVNTLRITGDPPLAEPDPEPMPEKAVG